MKYNPALDGIRALAVLAVVAVHSSMPWASIGYTGVDVFFVLSGFLITSLLRDQAERGGIRLGEFYLRRARRLYPALLAMLALYLATVPWLFPSPNHVREAGIAAVYLTDFALGRAPFEGTWAVGHTWSLAVEEQFYLVWPLVVVGLTRIRTRRYVAYLLLTAYLAQTLWRMWAHVEIGMMETYYRPDTHCGGLILGALLAYLPWRSRWWALAIPPLVLAAWWTLADGGPRSYPQFWMELAAAATILWAMSGAAGVLGWRPLVYVGQISYGLYLFHGPVAWVMRHIDAPWPQQAAVVFLSAFLLAHYSHRYIESRFRRPRQATSDSMDVRMLEVSAS
jgi:peptidoglycan/LPS O-acetylase OafA/YrhL